MIVEEPYRVRYTSCQQLRWTPDEVFPLLCPVREIDWVEGWEPRAVFSRSGVAEADCVFTMPGDPDDHVWVVTEYEPERWRIGFVKVVPGATVTRILMELHETDVGGTRAEIAYTTTALSERGRAMIDAMTPEAWEAFMRAEWENGLDGYLARRAGGD